MLNVRSWLQRQRRVLLSSVLLIYQFQSCLMWIKFQPAGSFPLSISLFCPDSKPCSLMGEKRSGCPLTNWRHCTSKAMARGGTGQYLGLLTPFPEGGSVITPNHPHLLWDSVETGRFRCSGWNGRMGQPALPCLLLVITSNAVVEGVPLVCCITRCSTASPSHAVPLVAGLPDEIQKY